MAGGFLAAVRGCCRQTGFQKRSTVRVESVAKCAVASKLQMDGRPHQHAAIEHKVAESRNSRRRTIFRPQHDGRAPHGLMAVDLAGDHVEPEGCSRVKLSPGATTQRTSQ